MNKFAKRMVQVLHKFTDEGIESLRGRVKNLDDAHLRNYLAVGKTFKFESGSAYRVTATGALLRVPPKPYRNKAERKRYLKARREDRGLSENEAKIARFKKGKAL